MSEQSRVSHPIYNLLPTGIEGFDSLAELALNMRWSWNHATDEVWRQLDPRLWEITHNPWVVLQTVSRDQIERVLADPAFRKNVDGLVEASRQATKAAAWFQNNHSDAPLTCAAYFSMELMLREALPIYSGGRLGNVAGDQLEAYTPEAGWALGDGQEHDHDPAWDAAEAAALYEVLEREVVRKFYARDKQVIPTARVARIRESTVRLTPRFSTNRGAERWPDFIGEASGRSGAVHVRETGFIWIAE
jgi:glucan phosphorylase